MKYDIETTDKATVLHILEPRLIYESLDPIQERLVGIIDEGVDKIIMDFAKVEYLDSFAVGFVMDMYRRVSANKGMLKLAGLQPRVKKILAITRVDNVIDIYKNVDAALQAF